MELLYTAIIRLFWWVLLPLTPEGTKASRLYIGSTSALDSLKASAHLREGRTVVWMHCASLGEFEQGLPVLESLRKAYPECCMHVSFFSPSGFDAVGNHPLIDSVSYLPPDTPAHAHAFVQLLKPSLIIWVRYDFWYWILRECARSNAHCVCIAALFRPSQPFFKYWGGFFRTMLRTFDHLFVQNQASLDLLHKVGFHNTSISGDTRFDRVMEQSRSVVSYEEFEHWAVGKPVLLAGSIWPEDMVVLSKVISELPEYQIIIAPHEVEEEKVHNCMHMVEEPFGLYTKGEWAHRILVLNTIGLLSRLYRIATVAYIGGAFGQGLHNCLEPASYGVGLVFGPNIDRYPEAQELVKLGAAMRVKTAEECLGAIRSVRSTPSLGILAREYVEQRVGATQAIVQYLNSQWKA